MSKTFQYNKAANTTYVYDTQYYYSPEKRRWCSHRKLIGKIDPVTGEEVPTGKRGRRPRPIPEVSAIQDLPQIPEGVVEEGGESAEKLLQELYARKIVNQELRGIIQEIRKLCAGNGRENLRKVRQYNKASDTTYVYVLEEYYDPDQKKWIKHRRMVGKVDPATGEEVPTGKAGRRRKASAEAEPPEEAAAPAEPEPPEKEDPEDGLGPLRRELEAAEEEGQKLRDLIIAIWRMAEGEKAI